MDAWRAYQRAFHDFSERVRHLQSLTTDPHPDRAAIEAALLEVEKTRVVYDRCRDAMARHFMPSSRRTAPHVADSRQSIDERVRTIAELLWESSGKPDGTAEEDWRRAEDIVRQAVTAA
ncbi:MAG TPA: DUF2934 domain-containing protein [Bryobacteraceae bacterium]|nr:DUF2934 domain-containing protein [Bryobacteraceae bacterium]